MQKRYEYWGTENGKPVKKWTEWFKYDGEKFKYQLGRKLLNEYKDE